MQDKTLIIGAGPTGLVLGLWLTHYGIPVRIIDKNPGPGTTSRAMAVHARTLEFYQQLGFAQDAVAKGIIATHINLRKNSNNIASIDIGGVAKNISAFPFILSFPQDDHEQLLIEQLASLGVHVERNTELISFTHDDKLVSATLRKGNQQEIVVTPYLFGCDGAKSTVRSQLNLEFEGGTYPQIYYVADVMTQGNVATDAVQVCLRDDGFSLAFPIRSSGSLRLIGIVPKDKEHLSNLQFADIEATAIKDMPLTVTSVNWFSTYHSHHRVAQQFRNGRVFLLGDAGHIHSPVGGQGMNTGIGDAVNLAWKVAAVLQHRANESILNSYEIERMSFANRLVHTTDTLFTAITSQGWSGKFFRKIFFPYILPFFARFQFIRNLQFRTVSQIEINYRNSPLSQGASGKIKAGDRLPWVTNESFDNYQPLSSIDWQIHVYGKVSDDLAHAIAETTLPCHVFAWQPSLKTTGLRENTLYLIRPDGYIAYIDANQNAQQLSNYLTKLSICPRK